MQFRGTSPESLAAALCLQNAAHSRPNDSSALDRTRGSLGIGEVDSQMRRLPGPMSGSGGQDFSLAQHRGGEVSSTPQEDDFEARGAYRKAPWHLREGDKEKMGRSGRGAAGS